MADQSVDAVVLTGGSTSRRFAEAAGVPAQVGARALADIGGRPMVEWVLAALEAAPAIRRVAVVGPPGFPRVQPAHSHVEMGGNLPTSIQAGIDALGPGDHVLLVTADLPFLTRDAVEDFVARGLEAMRSGADCCYAAVRREVCERDFPEMRRTWLRTPSGCLTGGNLVLQRASAFPKQRQAIEEAYRRRKSPVYLVGLIGIRKLMKLLTGRLTLTDIEQGAGRLMGVSCRLLVSPYAEVGTDVDRPEDLLQARARLGSSSDARVPTG